MANEERSARTRFISLDEMKYFDEIVVLSIFIFSLVQDCYTCLILSEDWCTEKAKKFRYGNGVEK